MKINVSIHDFSPLFRRHDSLFRDLKETGVDGVELVIGIKSRWSVQHYKKLSKSYNLPIVSLHQPIWSGLNLYFDEGFFALAKELNVKYVTCHPLPRASLHSKRMREYFKKLSKIKLNTGINILIENMPQKYNGAFVDNIFPLDVTTGDVMSLYKAVSKFGLDMTLDIDHLQSPTPHKESFFQTIYPKIKNIHLSSFDTNQNHLPLYMGKFRSQEFIDYLHKHEYKGLLTFEIDYPGLITWFGYNFEAVKRSVVLIKS